MELFDAIRGRRAVRDFTPAGVEESTLMTLIDAAIQAPSAIDRQPWHFAVVRDQALLDRISIAAKTHRLRSESVVELRKLLEDPGFHIFYHAPVLIVISAQRHTPWIVEDCSLAAQNLMLAAHGTGLGSCWIGFAQDFLNTEEGRVMLKLPGDALAVAPIIVGHPRSLPPPHARHAPQVSWVG